jgi:hypothetical protein
MGYCDGMQVLRWVLVTFGWSDNTGIMYTAWFGSLKVESVEARKEKNKHPNLIIVHWRESEWSLLCATKRSEWVIHLVSWNWLAWNVHHDNEIVKSENGRWVFGEKRRMSKMLFLPFERHNYRLTDKSSSLSERLKSMVTDWQTTILKWPLSEEFNLVLFPLAWFIDSTKISAEFQVFPLLRNKGLSIFTSL